MTPDQWLLVGTLAAGTFALRLCGYLVGDAIADRPRLRRVLDDLPGCLVVALVASSLATQGWTAWAAAGVALAVAIWTNAVLATMGAGLAVFVGLGML